VNVPTGVWIDERGRVVRPGEPSWSSDETFNVLDSRGRPIVTEGEKYVAALRDWVEKGERSQYALSDEVFRKRVSQRPANELEAEASFKLAVWFEQAGQPQRAAPYFERALTLNPGDWTYHRQYWNYEGQASGAKFRDKVKQLETPYYPTLDLEGK